MIKSKILDFLYRYVLPYGGLLLVKIIASTYRFGMVDLKNESDILDGGGSLIYASWHQRFFPGITFFATRKPIAIMISRSRDGEIISRAADVLGWSVVRGSSSRGGTEALQEIKRLALSGYKIGHILDGPRGPSGVVKPGLLSIAKVAGIPIIPTITSAQKRWTFNSWDRFMLPKPFSRIIIRFGRAIYVPAHLRADEFEQQRLFVEQRMHALYEDTDRIWTQPDSIRKIFN